MVQEVRAGGFYREWGRQGIFALAAAQEPNKRIARDKSGGALGSPGNRSWCSYSKGLSVLNRGIDVRHFI